MPIFGPGALFGFMPLLDGSPYPASAITQGEVDARVLSRSGLERALAQDPGISRALLAALSRRLRGAISKIELLSTRGATSRVAATLWALLPDDPVEPLMVQLPVASRELAEGLNLTAPTLSRALAELEGPDIVRKLGPGRYQVLDLDGLLALADRSGSSPLGPPL